MTASRAEMPAWLATTTTRVASLPALAFFLLRGVLAAENAREVALDVLGSGSLLGEAGRCLPSDPRAVKALVGRQFHHTHDASLRVRGAE